MAVVAFTSAVLCTPLTSPHFCSLKPSALHPTRTPQHVTPRRRTRACVSVPQVPPQQIPSDVPQEPYLPEEVDDAIMLDHMLQTTPGLVVLEVYSRSCRPCLRIKRALQKVAAAHAHHARFLLLSADREPALAQKLGVRAMPTFILFKDGTRIDHFSTSSRDTLEMYIADNV